MPEITLKYFKARGRLEMTRMIAAYGKIEFKEVNVEFHEWPALKPTVPYGSLPIMEVDGVVVGQSVAIARYVAKVAGIAGKNEIDQALADGLVDFVTDFLNGNVKARFPSSPEEKETQAHLIVNEKGPKFCQTLEAILKKNGGTYLVGDSLTYADIVVAQAQDLLDHPKEKAFEGITGVDERFKILDKFPLLKQHRDMVYNLDGIKDWVKNRPDTPL